MVHTRLVSERIFPMFTTKRVIQKPKPYEASGHRPLYVFWSFLWAFGDDPLLTLNSRTRKIAFLIYDPCSIATKISQKCHPSIINFNVFGVAVRSEMLRSGPIKPRNDITHPRQNDLDNRQGNSIVLFLDYANFEND